MKDVEYRHIDMYKSFRAEIDDLCIPKILTEFGYTVKDILTDDGKVAGIFVAAPDYIDCVYVKPEFRRKGLAKKTVLEFYRQYKYFRPCLHIIKGNKTALAFYNSLFVLRKVGENAMDTLYKILDEK